MKNVKIINSFPAQGLTIKNGLISAINARFYSNTNEKSLKNSIIINSNKEVLNFIKHNYKIKAGLYLPPLSPFKELFNSGILIENNNPEPSNLGDSAIPTEFIRLLNNFKDFSSSLVGVINNLIISDHDHYQLSFFFYTEGLEKGVLEVYNNDFFNKNCLNKTIGNFGYTCFLHIYEVFTKETISGKKYELISSELHQRLEELCSKTIQLNDQDPGQSIENTINFDKESLLVITKCNQEDNENFGDKHASPGNMFKNDFPSQALHGVKSNTSWRRKRYYSTFSAKAAQAPDVSLDQPKSLPHNNLIENKSSLGAEFIQDQKYFNFYSELKYFIDNNPISNESQIKIENFLLDNGIQDSSKNDIGGLFNGMYSKKTSDFLLKFKPDILKKINNFMKFKSEYEANKSNKGNYKLILVDIIETVGKSYILTALFGRFIKILSNSRSNYSYEKNLVLDTALDLGKDLIRKYLSVKYKKYLTEFVEGDTLTIKISKVSFSDWKNKNLNINNYLDDSELKVSIGVILIEWLEDCNLLTKKLVKLQSSQHNIYESSEALIEEWENKLYNEIWSSTQSSEILLQKKNILLSPVIRLPSIVKPKLYIYSKDKVDLGGYLLNEVEYSDPLILKNPTQEKQSIISEDLIYEMVNKINSIGYKINSDLLNFININFNLYNNELLMDDHPLEEKKQLTKKEKTELQKYTSKKLQQNHILNIAYLFLNIPEFYFINKIDNRGRLYCVCEYLNYQSTDLAKALLLFSKPNQISRFDESALMFLKVYGANCYGNKIDKMSIDKKVEWVNENKEKLINFESGEIIKKADNKLLFTAFCIEYKKWWDFYDNPREPYFNTYLPIQLDASCNGFQHLVLLSGESNLRKELNLTESDYSKDPYDFYSYILEVFKNHLNNLNYEKLTNPQKDSYERIKLFSLDRQIIKKVIMTIPYNASSRKMVDYIAEMLVTHNEKIGDEYYTHFSHPRDSSPKKFKLTYKDLNILVTDLKAVLDKKAPKIAKLKEYLKKIAALCTELKIHIPWNLPIGLEVRQSYLEEESVYLKPFSYSNSRIKLSSFSKSKLDLAKQVRAFMPNLIHSLDASSLMLLMQKYFNNSEFNTKNIYTIHDCFAMPMNHVEFIIDNLRLVYISLYSDADFLKKLDEGIYNNILFHYNAVSLDRDKNILTVIQDNNKKKFIYPNINEVLGKNLPKLKLDKNIKYIIV